MGKLSARQQLLQALAKDRAATLNTNPAERALLVEDGLLLFNGMTDAELCDAAEEAQLQEEDDAIAGAIHQLRQD